jgi:hypothetical protein
MRDLFPGWVPPGQATLDLYWREATFAVDTSVLLDLYRFSEEARNGLLDALDSLRDRLWIPHQVGLEFHRNRYGVLLDQREAEVKLLSQLDELQQELDSQLSQRLRGVGRRDLAPLRQAVNEGIESLRSKLQEAEKAHTKGLGGSIQEDPIYDQVVALIGDRIGDPYEPQRKAEVIADAEKRFEQETPPGYMDAKKEGEERYGDVILWHQLCDRAAETKKPIVLVADDQKSDWIWEVRGKKLGPRPELVAEMQMKAGVGFYLYTPKRLLQIWEKREEGRSVEPEVWEEIEGPVARDQERRDDEPSLFLGALRRAVDQFKEASTASEAEQLLAWAEASAQEKGPPSPVPIHLVTGEEATLGLSYQAHSEQDANGKVSVVVTRPDGEAFGAFASHVDRPSEGQRRYAMVKFPQDFAITEPLEAGTYGVSWGVLLSRGMPNARRGRLAVSFGSFCD